MRDQPVELADRALFEVLLLARGVGRKRLRELNRRAIGEQVNLALTLGAADEPTRNWVAANALRSSPLGAGAPDALNHGSQGRRWRAVRPLLRPRAAPR
ncbi:MAG: hypothetical protein ACR2H2_11175 [Solirubrobacteraceae bacterium]